MGYDTPATRAARIQRAISHCCPTCGGPLTFKQLHVDLDTNTLYGDGVACKVPPRHAEIAFLLNKRFPGWVSNGSIIERVWSNQDISSTLLNTTICFTRRSVEKVGYGIKNEFGAGYRLVRL